MRRHAALFGLLGILLAVPALGQEFARAQLESSPRHHEWVEVQAGDRTVHSFVAYPERADDALAVIVLHENRGLTDWVRSFADQLAAQGYLAIAPDLLSEFDAEHARTSDFASSDDARTAIYELDPAQVTSDLLAVKGYIEGVPASSGRSVVVGFCWGGSQAFRFASNAPDLAGAFVFYGTAPEEPEPFARITAPVYGFYGENDQRVNATIDPTRTHMQAHEKTYDVVIYDEAGHGFMRDGDDPAGDPANRAARDAAWERLVELLNDLEE